MSFNTATFILGGVRYCSYCGEIAKSVDEGSTHNHRWEEDWVHFCECETAKIEIDLRSELATLKNKAFHIEHYKLKDLEKLTDNPIVNKIKYEHESKSLKEKYKIQ